MIGYIFMSYSRKDEEHMRQIAKFLRGQGLKVWVDNEKLIPGTPIWEEEVEKGIRNASAIVVVLSPDSKSSEWVRREISMADQHHKRVFPVLVRGDETSSITLRLINRQYVDLRANSEKGLKSLSEAIAFYISELVLPENYKTTEPSPASVAPPISNQPISSERKTNPQPVQRTEQPAVDEAKRGGIFGWMSSSKEDAKRLLAQVADPTKRDQAARELIGLDAEAIPVLLDALQTKDLSLLPIYQQILARIPSASPALTKALTTAHPIVRARIADVFAINKDKAAVPVLLEALQGDYFTVRASAAKALGRIGDPKAIPPLLNMLKDRESEVRIGACLALGLFKDPTTVDEIANVLLDDPKIEVRQAAAKALGYAQHPEALPYLMEALRDSVWWYEREIQAGDLFDAIIKLGTVSVDPLIEALTDNEGTVRKYAAALLGRLGDARAIEPLGMALYDLHHEVGKASAEALTNFGVSSFEILVEALDHPEMWIRIHSVDVLPKIKEPRVALVLLEMLKDPEREVKQHVIDAMGELKDVRTLPALQEIMAQRGDREMHAWAKAAIEKIG